MDPVHLQSLQTDIPCNSQEIIQGVFSNVNKTAAFNFLLKPQFLKTFTSQDVHLRVIRQIHVNRSHGDITF